MSAQSTRESLSKFHEGEIDAQYLWGLDGQWDQERIEKLLWNHIPDKYHKRIEQAQFFFLATSNSNGECDCSFKGGGPNLIRMLSATQLAFPDFDGNGAFMSLGNILQNPHVGMLFIDFSDGARLRVNGSAQVYDDGEMMGLFNNASRVIVVDVDLVVPNCNAYIPVMKTVSS